MKITLTNAFEKADVETHTVVFGSKNIAVFCLEEKFSLMEGSGDYSLKDYAELIFAANGFDAEYVENANGLNGFEYVADGSDGKKYKYYTYVFKETDAFWMVQFAVSVENVEAYEDKIISWAQTVEFYD